MRKPVTLSKSRARQIWLRAQRLDTPAPFGDGPQATRAAIEHLGYVQIDTINVIERCHHHILFTRIPGYQRAHLRQAQSIDKAVFEYWTHALAYVPVSDFRFHVPEMKRHRKEPHRWFAKDGEQEYRRVLQLVRNEGALTIRDIDDDVLVEKDHPWASRKPSKAALQLGFYNGVLTISERTGMLKTYELATRHFGWDKLPRPASESQVLNHLLDRALRAQGIVSLQSILHTHARIRPALKALIEARVKRRRLVPVALEGAEKAELWAAPPTLEENIDPGAPLVHILSPFDPLVIQRKRLGLFFGYDHIFEAYVPKEKRRFGYFTLPVLIGDEIVAAIDLKTDRTAGKLLIQNWTWVGQGNRTQHQAAIEEALGRFEAFQLAS
ncbi:MAG: winged helix-turn-helix domain-containing protein [Devosia sp.]